MGFLVVLPLLIPLSFLALHWNLDAKSSKRAHWGSMSLFRSHKTSNSSMGPSFEQDGPIFWVNAFSNEPSRGGFPNNYNELWVASFGRNYHFGEKNWSDFSVKFFSLKLKVLFLFSLFLPSSFFWSYGFCCVQLSFAFWLCFWLWFSRLVLAFYFLLLYLLIGVLLEQVVFSNELCCWWYKFPRYRNCYSSNTHSQSNKTTTPLSVMSWEETHGRLIRIAIILTRKLLIF